LTATRALLSREIRAFFETPVIWVVAVVFLMASALLFFSVLFLFDRAEMRQFFANIPILGALVLPALAMRLVAEERRRGTFEILATLPLRTSDIVVAKFLAVWISSVFLLVPTLLFVVTVGSLGRLDPGPVVGGYAGTVLLFGVYSAIGVFASSVSRSETVALMIGLVITLFFALIRSFLVLVPALLVPYFEFLSVGYHFDGFTRGVVDSRSIVYFATLAVFFLALAHRRLTAQR
jgi:ABC-2 type transport system permease protein